MISTLALVLMSEALTWRLPETVIRTVSGVSEVRRTRSFLRLSRMLMTSSCTPVMVEYSWRAPRMRTATAAAPSRLESSILRSELPIVCP